MRRIRISKSPQHKTIIICNEGRYGNNYIITLDLQELKEFLEDEYTDIKEFEDAR